MLSHRVSPSRLAERRYEMSLTQPTNPFGVEMKREWLTDLENRTNFWNRNPQLQYIAWIAQQEGVSPWGLLLAVMLHRLSHISPTVVLPKRDGSTGTSLVSGTSLNLFGSLVGDSGGGKSVIFRESSEIMPPVHRPLSDGTGQGIVKAIAETERRVKDDDGNPLSEPQYVTRFLRHALVMHAPEIKTLNAEFTREGSKTDSMMRSIWTGETVGMTTGDKDRRATLPANMYRICGLWGVQPVNAGGILAGADDGTPQRWIWAPAEEFRRGSKAPVRTQPPSTVDFPVPVYAPGQNPFGVSGGDLPQVLADDDPLPAPIWVQWSPQMHVDVKTLRAEREALRDRDPYEDIPAEREAEEHRVLMESHLILTRIKLATALGALWGHTSPDDQDWELAGIQLEVSKRELAGVWKSGKKAELKEMSKEGTNRGYMAHIAREAMASAEETAAHELADYIWQLLKNRPMTNRELRSKVSSSKRKLIATALDALESKGLLAVDAANMYWALWQGTPLPYDLASQFKTG